MGVALLLAIALSLLSRASSHVRYVVIAGALLLCGALPVATWILLAPQAPPFVSPETALPLATDAQAAPPAPADLHPDAIMERPVDVQERWQARLARLANVALPDVVGLWLVGVLILTLRLTLVWMWMRQLCLSGLPIREAPCLERFRGLREQMRIGVPVRLLQSALVEVPTLIGWLRPTILVPASVFVGLTPGQLDAILAHELAHVRRYDYLVNLFQTALETILFYHPAVWWISHKLREERENCCDDVALEVTEDRFVYASALARLEEGRGLPFALTASGGSLLQRIRRIAGVNDRKVSAWPLWVLIMGILSVAWLPKSNAAATTAVAPSQPVAKAMGENSTLIRIATKVVQIDEDDYQAHLVDIDDAVKKGDIDSLAHLKSFDLLNNNAILSRSGEQGVMENVRVLPVPIQYEKEVTGEMSFTDFLRKNIGIRFVLVPVFQDGKVTVSGSLEVITLRGWTPLDKKSYLPVLDYGGIRLVFLSLNSGQTIGTAAPDLQQDAHDPSAYFRPNDWAHAPPRSKKLCRLFLFMNAQVFHKNGKPMTEQSLDNAPANVDEPFASQSAAAKRDDHLFNDLQAQDMTMGKGDPDHIKGTMSEREAKRRGVAAVVKGKPIFWSDSKNYSLPIEYCIDRELQIQSARALGYSTPQIVLDKRIDSNVKIFGGDRNAFVENLNKNGISFDQFLDRVRGDDMSEHMFVLNVDEPAKEYIQSLHLSKPATEQEKKQKDVFFQEKTTQLSSAWMQDLRSKAAIQRFEDAKTSSENFHSEPSSPKTAFTFDSSSQDNGEPLTVKTFLSPNDFFRATWRDTVDLKRELIARGIEFPRDATIFYLPTSNKLVVRNTPEQLDKISTLLEKFFQEKTQPESRMPQNHVMEKTSEKLQAPDSLKQDINFAFLNPCDESPGILDVDFSYRADISPLLSPLKDRHLVPILPVLSSPVARPSPSADFP